MADTPSGFAGAAGNVRDTAKWLLAAFAAIGVVLISGVQFSDVATLDSPQREQALALGALGLLGLALAVTGVADLLLPRSYTLKQLSEGSTRQERSIRDALNARSELLGGAGDVASLDQELATAMAEEKTARTEWETVDDAGRPNAEKVLKSKAATLAYVSAVTANAGDWANYLGLRKAYTSAFRYRILPGVLVAIVGFTGVLLLSANPSNQQPLSMSMAVVPSGGSFANARLSGANLSKVKMAGVDFRGADLTSADLSDGVFKGSDFSYANLRNAKLSGADLEGVTWKQTICPDGENSDAVGGSCGAHLTTPSD
jgi:hypothetical protein